jgi:hypothetical protein
MRNALGTRERVSRRCSSFLLTCFAGGSAMSKSAVFCAFGTGVGYGLCASPLMWWHAQYGFH